MEFFEEKNCLGERGLKTKTKSKTPLENVLFGEKGYLGERGLKTKKSKPPSKNGLFKEKSYLGRRSLGSVQVLPKQVFFFKKSIFRRGFTFL